MFDYRFVTLILISVIKLTFASGYVDKPIHMCTLGKIHLDSVCTFTNIVEMSSDYDWEVESDKTAPVDRLVFSNCSIRVITNVFCEKENFLTRINLSYAGVEEISEGAFRACDVLVHLHLNNNKIKRISKNIFSFNTKLRSLDLSNNKIENLICDFSNLKHLHGFYVANNNLTNFSPDLLKNSRNLITLSLYSNDLSDLNIEKMIHYFPKLQEVEIDDNEISCIRLGEIFKIFQSNGIKYKKSSVIKTRYYNQTVIDGDKKCNPDIEWQASKYRKEFWVMDKMVFEIKKRQKENDRDLYKVSHNFEKSFKILIKNVNDYVV